MPEDLGSILRRVSAGELSPEAAEPMVAEAISHGPSRPTQPMPEQQAERERDERRGEQRRVTLKVIEGGRVVVHMRTPTAWASLASSALPGLSGAHAERIREAIRGDEVGPILEVRDENGDGVIISTE